MYGHTFTFITLPMHAMYVSMTPVDHPGSDEGGVGEAVGATVAVFLLLIIIVAVVLLLVVCVRYIRHPINSVYSSIVNSLCWYICV